MSKLEKIAKTPSNLIFERKILRILGAKIQTLQDRIKSKLHHKLDFAPQFELIVQDYYTSLII